MPSHRGRLARLAAQQGRRDARWDMLAHWHRRHGGALRRAEAIHEGLIRLGVDPARAATISDVERKRTDLTSLPPLPEAYVHPPQIVTDEDHALLARFQRDLERFRDPATPPPVLEEAAQNTLLAYVRARAADPPPACDTVSGTHGLTPADGKADSTGPN